MAYSNSSSAADFNNNRELNQSSKPYENNDMDKVELKRQPKLRVPIFVDLVNNSARSRFLGVMLFAFVAAIVTFYFTSSVFADAHLSTVKIGFSESPPITSAFGSKFDNFSVRLTNQWGLGISDVEAVVTMYPIASFHLEANMNSYLASSDQEGRTVDCVKHFISQTSVTWAEDQSLCDLASAGALEQATAKTNSDGIAVFTNFRVKFGYPGTYALIVTHKKDQAKGDPHKKYVESSITLRTPVSGIQAPPVIGTQLKTGTPFSISAVLTLTPTVAESDPVGSLFGVKTKEEKEAALADPLAEFDGLMCSVLSFSVQAPERFLWLTNTFGIVHNVTLKSRTVSQYTGTSDTFTANVDFKDVTITGFSGSPDGHRILISCLGQGFLVGGAPPPSVKDANPKEMTPGELPWPFPVETAVAKVEAIAVLRPKDSVVKSPHLYTVEGEYIPSVTARVLDSSGKGIGGKICVMSARVSSAAFQNIAVALFSYGASAGVNVHKELFDGVSSTSNENGEVTFNNVYFSKSGQIGEHHLSITCDGVTLTDIYNGVSFALAATAGPIMTSSRITIYVNTTVTTNSFVVYDGIPQWLPLEEQMDGVVGTPLVTTPSIKVVNVNTGIPIAGKTAHVVATPSNSSSTTFFTVASRSVPSDVKGIITFEHIVVTSMNSTQPENVTFHFVVDGVYSEVLTVERQIFPINPKTPVADLPAAILPTCNGISIVNVGPYLAAAYGNDSSIVPGTPLDAEYVVFSQYGAPIPLAPVVIEILDSEGDPVANSVAGDPSGPKFHKDGDPLDKLADNSSIIYTDANGRFKTSEYAIANIKSDSSVDTGNTKVFIGIRCHSRHYATSLTAPFIVAPRVLATTGITLDHTMNPTSLTANLQIELNRFVDPSIASTSRPIGAQLRIEWQSTYFRDYFPQVVFPVVAISGSGSYTVSINLPITPKGGAYFAFRLVLDGHDTGHITTLRIADEVASISLVQGVGSSVDLTGGAFAQQPVVRVRNSGGNSVTGAAVYAQLVVVGTPPNTTYPPSVPHLLHPLSNADDFAVGMLAKFSATTSEAPTSATSIAGVAGFLGLGVVGLSAPSHTYRIRYAVSPTVFVDDPQLLDPAGITSSSGTGPDGATLPNTVQLLSVPNLYAVPGVPMSSSILTSVFKPSLIPLIGAKGRVSVVNSTTAKIVSTPEIVSGDDISGLLRAKNFQFSEYSPLGQYQLQMVVPGGRSGGSSFITVTRSAFSIEIISAPPANVLVGNGFHAVVKVKIPDGEGLPNMLVRAELESQNTSCIGQGCGVLQSNTATTITNSTGFAKFFLVLDSGSSDIYSLRFVVEGSGGSIIDQLNGFASGVSQAAFGANLASAAVSSQLEALPVQTSTTQQASSAVSSGISTLNNVPTFIGDKIQEQKEGSVLTTLATSAAYKTLKSSTEISTTSNTFSVWNHVNHIEIVKHPSLSLSGFQSTAFFSTMPRIRVLDSYGNPVANKAVEVHVRPSSLNLEYDREKTVSGSDGVIDFTDLKVKSGIADTYKLAFSVDGVVSGYSNPFTLGPQSVSQSQQVQIVSALVLLIMSPLFFANVPHARWQYYLASFFVLVIVPILAINWIQVNVFEAENLFLQLHASMLSVIWTVVTIGYLIMFLFTFLSQKHWWVRRFNDEDRMLHAYRYTKWLISARRPQLSQEEWEEKIKEDKRKSFLGQAQLKFEELFPSQIGTLDKLFGDNGEISIYEKNEFHPPPLEVPSNIKPIWYPTKFLIVLSISVVLMIVASFLAFHMLWNLIDTLDEIQAILPEPPQNLDANEKQEINQEIQSAIIVGFNLVGDANANLAFLKNMDQNIANFDIFNMWEKTHLIVKDIRRVILSSGDFGLSCALLAVGATWLTLWFAVKRIMWQIRRGEHREMKKSCSLILSDRYVGMHVMHFVIVFLSVYFIGFIVMLFISAHELLILIIAEFWYTILTSLITVILTVIMEVLIVGRWWVFGFTIKLLNPYFMWTVIGIILSLVNGVIQTIVRWIKAIFSITVLFARLDLDMFPAVLLFLDTGYWAFYSMLFADEEYNNPIFLSAVSVFMSELIMKREFEKDVQTPLEHFGMGTITLPHILNITRIHMRDRCGENWKLHIKPISEHYPWDLHLMDVKNRRRRRAAARWRLTALLVMNPSLMQYRKHRVLPEQEEEVLDRKLKPWQLREKRRRSTIVGSGVLPEAVEAAATTAAATAATAATNVASAAKTATDAVVQSGAHATVKASQAMTRTTLPQNIMSSAQKVFSNFKSPFGGSPSNNSDRDVASNDNNNAVGHHGNNGRQYQDNNAVGGGGGNQLPAPEPSQLVTPKGDMDLESV